MSPVHFAILGIKKRKGRADLQRCADHHLRARPVANADERRTGDNLTTWHTGAAALVDDILATTAPLKRRKDAVDALELMLTASPQWFAEHGGTGKHVDLTRAALDWAGRTFGEDNVVAAGVHLDETTPHVWLIVLPITKQGRLSASHWTDGPAAMRKLHDGWAKATKHLGLTRGVEGSPSRHVEIRDYYAAQQGSIAAVARVEGEMRRRAISARRVEAGANKRAAELDDELTSRAAELERRERLLAKREAILRDQRAEISRLFAALTPEQEQRAAERFARSGPVSTPPDASERATARSTWSEVPPATITKRRAP